MAPNSDSTNNQSGFLGSSLFPSFDPIEIGSESDADNEPKTVSKTSSAFPSFTSFAFPAFSSFEPNVHAAATAASRSADPVKGEVADLERKHRNRTRGSDSDDSQPKSHKKSKHNKHKKEKKDKDGPRKHGSVTVYRAAENSTSTSSDLIIPTFSATAKHAASSDPAPFTFDRRGDQDNVRYGSANSSKVPRYFSVGNRILGASDRNFRISHKLGNSVVVYKLHMPKERLTARDFRMALRGKPIRIRTLMRTSAIEPMSHSDDYVSFETTPSLQVARNNDNDNEEEENHESNLPTSKHLQESPEFMQETRRLNLRLENNPTNLSTWLELLQLQDSLVAAATAESTNERSLRALKKAITEKKIAIYEKALQVHSGEPKLLLPFLEMVQEVWDAPRLLTAWDRVLKRANRSISDGNASIDDVRGAFQIWDRYLTFRMTSYLSFSVNSCLDAYGQCLDAFRVDHDSDEHQSCMLHFFTRACSLLFDSGYTERAVALYQAMVEFACFTPAAFETMDFEQRVDMFEEFWESECARVGEKGATGWRNNVLGAQGVPGYAAARVESIGQDSSDEYAAWFLKESESSFMNWAPQRSTRAQNGSEMGGGSEDEDEDDMDPFATIIFDDVRPFLFPLTNPTLKAQLIANFSNLLHCQMNATQSSSRLGTPSAAMYQTHLMNTVLLTNFFPPNTTELAESNLEEKPGGSKANSVFPIKSFPLCVSNIFNTSLANSASVFDSLQVSAIHEAGNGRLDFVKNVVSQCRGLDELDDIALPILLSFEAAREGLKSAQKMGKGMLKAERMNLSLWAIYAGMEAMRGKLDEARKIYQTAIMSYRSFPPESQHDAAVLHLAYAELEMENRCYTSALLVLTAFSDSSVDLSLSSDTEKPTATRLLKARKFLQEMTDAAVKKCSVSLETVPASQSLRITAALVSCCGMFEYLVADKIDDSLAYFNNTLSVVKIPALRELITEFKLRLHIGHSRRPGFFVRPGDLRDEMEAAVQEFPANSVFLTLFVANEAKHKIENRVRRLIDSCLKANPSSTLWAFSIWTELHHHSSQTYNQNSVRSLLTRAIECPVGRYSPQLWHVAIVFEIWTGNLPRAKQLLFRAIRECPWNKSLYMLAVGELRGVFGEDEVAEILGVMEEKEIRVRVSVD
ncbi:NRDE-2, necessary for RNA interference-domain-containing protein [Chytriomyces cf. hyalinus JEL632]|nr:NRDE-2, necessary for RNA interference-domain-containing protein [Chytriomyces cf. hyalinus JEL632]